VIVDVVAAMAVNVRWYSLVDRYHRFEELYASIFMVDNEDGGRNFKPKQRAQRQTTVMTCAFYVSSRVSILAIYA
jgi:hypothetical protein